MSRLAIVIALGMIATACRAGFPSLSEAPELNPERLVQARAAAAADRDRLLEASAEMSEPAPAPAYGRPGAAARLIATLPADGEATSGVLDRAVAEADRLNRALHVVGVGADGIQGAEHVRAALRRRGAEASISQFAALNVSANRVELYLLP